jgi:two-component system chemotaxis response regulator CheY
MEEDQVKKKIMLVDDDNFLLEMYARKFANSGFEIISATSGEDAINQLMNTQDLDVLMFDIVMPEMDGIDLLKKVKEENLAPKALKIVLSNQGQQVEIEKAEGIGVDGYIVKALHTPSEVVKKVSEIIANKS